MQNKWDNYSKFTGILVKSELNVTIQSTFMNLIWTKLPFPLTSLHDLQFFAISYFCSCINRPVIVITTLQFRHVTLSLKYARIDPVFEYPEQFVLLL